MLFNKLVKMKRLSLVAIAAVLVLHITPMFNTVSALSPVQRKLYNSGVFYYDHEVARAKNNACLAGANNPEKVWNFFSGERFEPWQTAGIMGNMMEESKLNPRSIQPYPKEGDHPIRNTGFGLVQWTYADRQIPLEQKAQAAGVLPSDITIQLQYVMDELNGRWKSTLDKFRATTTVEQATQVILNEYEISANKSVQGPLRLDHAKNFLTEFGAGGGTGGTCGGGVDGWVWPAGPTTTLTSCYGPRRAPTAGASTNHKGVDIAGGNGSPIFAAADGEVVTAAPTGAAGLLIVIEHAGNSKTRYMHNSRLHVQTGDKVTAGQHIADEGSTGRVTGAHLHFEIIRDGKNINPLDDLSIPAGVNNRANCASSATKP